jgi:hypothetical protein
LPSRIRRNRPGLQVETGQDLPRLARGDLRAVLGASPIITAPAACSRNLPWSLFEPIVPPEMLGPTCDATRSGVAAHPITARNAKKRRRDDHATGRAASGHVAADRPRHGILRSSPDGPSRTSDVESDHRRQRHDWGNRARHRCEPPNAVPGPAEEGCGGRDEARPTLAIALDACSAALRACSRISPSGCGPCSIERVCRHIE